MSFITKRERVFNEYDLYDVPARNEGKLKAYGSCTDARAWSHFCSDKSEHLVEIIKRNNDICRPKYVPTEAIVNTLMVGKNAEIARLHCKIEQFEQMLAAYDLLELTCDQKCEIAKAHAEIKDANKQLDELWLDLDISGFYSEGVDSEAFETGKSRGDEPSRFQEGVVETPVSKVDELTPEREPAKEDIKSNQVEISYPRDASTSATDTTATDTRIQSMQEAIITKDAKLNAMQNTLAVFENDVCEPYCIYAHIYTALEKIFATLRQNEKYKLYLDLMTSGRDTRCIDIKGRILYKLKVLENFGFALIAPCSQDYGTPSAQDCACYRADIETVYSLTAAESQQPCLDNKRAQLVADIMENDEMKEILSKENACLKKELEMDDFGIHNYNIESENLKRLKNLQESYDELMTCFEALKHEKDCLRVRCFKYEELDKEFEGLKGQLREYSALWNEKEHYQKRSADLDSLKEQYLVLSEETANLELQLKAESTINKVKAKTIDDLRRENLLLEQKLNEAAMLFEKEKNSLQCKIKECDCKVMCQDQQIKSLSIQIDRLLEQDPDKVQPKETEQASVAVRDEINSLNEQILNLRDVCICNDEEKQQMQEEFQANLNLTNDLKLQIEDWKSEYERTIQRNDYLEKYIDNCRDEIQELIESNSLLTQDVKKTTTALENLKGIYNQKSEEVNRLMEDMEKRNNENNNLYKQIQTLQETYNRSFTALDIEKVEAIKYLQLARQESLELLEKVRDYDDMVQKQDDLTTSFQSQNEKYNNLKSLMMETQDQNKNLDLSSRDSNNSILLQEVQRLREVNQFAATNISHLQDEKDKYKLSVEITKKNSKTLLEKLHKFVDLSDKYQTLKDSHERLVRDKSRLENELQNKTVELDDALHSIQLKSHESEELMNRLHGSENLKTDLSQMNDAYTRIIVEKKSLQNELTKNKNDYNNLLQSFNHLKLENEQHSQEVDAFNRDLAAIKRDYDNIVAEKKILQSDFDKKTHEINNLNNTLETKMEENRELHQRLANVENDHKAVTSNNNSLLQENISNKTSLTALEKKSVEFIERIKFYEALKLEYDKLKISHGQVQAERNKLKRELDHQQTDLRRIERENHDLSSQSHNLLSHSEVLEKSLIDARNELKTKTSFPDNPHAEIIKEIEVMKQEKLSQHKKIRDLLDRLDASENLITDLEEAISARDDKIAILENQINNLEDEVRNLQYSLAEVVNTGEQITDHSSQKINQSRLAMEAHHSRATHNMKMEIVQLQNVKTLLEEKLSSTKIRNEETARDKHKYLSQISLLQNERQIIVTDIKQLELRSVGDSALSPDKCDVEDILASLDRISHFIDVGSSKSNLLEETLISVKNSYHLVQTKTDEAKKIVEKEKQKILNEKEEAIRDRINMENQLTDLKNQMEQQILIDKNVIEELKAEIMNQKLIIDKVNQSTQSYISKLKDDMKTLQQLYQTSLDNTTTLENKLKHVSEEKSRFMGILEKTRKDLEEKIKEVGLLNQTLSELKKEPGRNMSIQTSGIPTYRNVVTQTDDEINYEESKKIIEKYDNLGENENINLVNANKIIPDRKPIPNNKNKAVNEVQVLTANVDPCFDYVRSSYLNYKFKQLGPGRLEHYSISCLSESMEIKNEGFSSTYDENQSQVIPEPEISSKVDPKTQIFRVIDIYNKKSMHTDSSKAIVNDDTENEVDMNISTKQSKHPNKSSDFTVFGLTNESSATINNINNEYKDSILFGSTSEVSTDKDLFVIYKDSEGYQDKSYEKKIPWNANENSEIVVKSVTVHQNKNVQQNSTNQRPNKKHSKKHEINIGPFINVGDEYEQDDSVKHKLKISLPRVETDIPSIEASDTDKKSFDSYKMAIYPLPKVYSSSDYDNSNVKFQDGKFRIPSPDSISHNNHPYRDITKTKTEQIRNINNKKESIEGNQNKFTDPKAVNRDNFNKNESHHKLSRVEANFLLIKSEQGHAEPIDSSSYSQQKSRDFGLDYILQSHNDPDNIKTYIAAKALRKTQSDERFYLSKLPEKSGHSPLGLNELKKSSTDYKTLSSNSYSKTSDKSQPKLTERSIMVKLDTVEEYENKIKYLTITLENIEKDYKKKIDAIKMQYDNNIKSILNEHNQGVESIQSLHEETLQDILKIHENEVENLRTMSIEAMRKADKLEKENKSLKHKMIDASSCLDEEPIKMYTPELKHRKRSPINPTFLTKTNVEAFNVKPKSKSSGPCTCSLDINISDTIRNIFEQVDVEQRKMAEYTYLKYIANKIMNGNVDVLDTQELSFLHLKVCRIWKTKLNKEESLQKRIDSLEAELMNKQKNAQHNIAELDRKVAEERRRLQEVREAVCRNIPMPMDSSYMTPVPPTAEKDCLGCSCPGTRYDLCERRSAGDIAPIPCGIRAKRPRNESNRAVMARLDGEERREREKKIYTDELPTRLRRSHDRPLRPTKK